MMKIVQINATCGTGSTGNICMDISKLLTERGVENYILFSTRTNGYEKGIPCADRKYVRWQAGKSRVFGNYGFNSKKATRRMIAELERIKPDIVHLHNIHGHDCHLGMLFKYFHEKKIKLYWTFHDCWAFTAYCPYFTLAKCDKWQSGCEKCPLYRKYSWLFDRSRALYRKKKALFSGLDLTIITPSQWLADLVKQSFMKDYPVKVIYNGIDLTVFHPMESDFREKYGIPQSKTVLLGVAYGWDVRKGLDVFVELSKTLDPAGYQIVLVGTNEIIDQQLPSNIISIHRTLNRQELANIYASSDVFLNPTREDNFPTVNLESLACGTPVLTFNTGGSPECINEQTGEILDTEDPMQLCDRIERIRREAPYSKEACIQRARQFDKMLKFREYIELYNALMNK